MNNFNLEDILNDEELNGSIDIDHANIEEILNEEDSKSHSDISEVDNKRSPILNRNSKSGINESKCIEVPS